jgi:tetratricopeptide (TPR) repeat protein
MYSQTVISTAAPLSRLDRLAALLNAEPDNLPLHRECVELAMRERQYQRALELVDARLALHPAEAEALFNRSNALIGLQRHADALIVLKALEDQGVAQLAVMRNIATCHYLLRQFENARAYAERLIAAGETSAGTLHLAISSLHHLGEIEAAVKLADAHHGAAEQDGPLAGVCALVYIDGDQSAKAGKLAAVALAHNPDSIEGLTAAATLASAALETEQAERQFGRIAELAPNNGRAWLGLGTLAMLAQDFNRARDCLAQATQMMPNHVGSWHSLAWTHLFSGDQAGAENYFAHALELDRNFAESHGAMAAMLAMKGDREGAEREIEIAERLDRKGASAQFARAILIGQVSGPDASREFIFNAVRLLSSRFSGKARTVLKDLTSQSPRAQ